MRTAARHVVAATVGGLVLSGLAAPAVAQPSPPGNNGTVKIDDLEFDDHPNNEPHDGCVFQVDFYGFDLGDLDATITFTLVPPTGDNVDILDDERSIGEDAAGGGTDVDGSSTYDLTTLLAGVTPHDQQGIHLRLTVHAEGSIGADTKFKVFWVTGCGTPPTTSPPSTHPPKDPPKDPPSPSTTGSPTTSITPNSGPTTIVPGATTTTPGSPPAPPAGPGGGDATVTPAASVSSGTLPLTGTTAAPLVAVALVLATVGVATGVAARKLRAGRTDS
jgi:hypothetical protein